MKNYLFHIVEITELMKLIVNDRLKTNKQTFSYVACLYNLNEKKQEPLAYNVVFDSKSFVCWDIEKKAK